MSLLPARTCFIFLSCLPWVFSCAPAYAAESKTSTIAGPGAAKDSPPLTKHEKWSARVLKLADNIDGFFGNDRIDEDAQQTRLKLTLDLRTEEGESLNTKTRVRVRLSLPRLENKWAVIVNGDEDDDEYISSAENEDEEDRSVSLRFTPVNDVRKNLSFDAGFSRPDGHYEVFGRMRYQDTKPMNKWLSRWDNRLYYYNDFGAEYDGTLLFDRALPPSLMFRTSTRLRWWESDKKCNGGICPEQHFVLYQRMKSRAHAISYESNTFFETEPFDGSKDYVSETNLRVRYRRKTHWDWAFFELRPTLAFPRDIGYDPTWRFLIRFEGIFGYSPKYDKIQFGPESVLETSAHQN